MNLIRLQNCLQNFVPAALLALAVPCAVAADMAPAPAPAQAPAQARSLAPARALIAEKNWAAAIDELKRVNDSASADWNNLMGYSLRNSKTPDYAAAAGHYEQALRIDPKHRGALEYSGELHLLTGDLPKAEQRLAVLGQACPAGCEELGDLKGAVQRYKSNGNRYVAAP